MNPEYIILSPHTFKLQTGVCIQPFILPEFEALYTWSGVTVNQIENTFYLFIFSFFKDVSQCRSFRQSIVVVWFLEDENNGYFWGNDFDFKHYIFYSYGWQISFTWIELVNRFYDENTNSSFFTFNFQKDISISKLKSCFDFSNGEWRHLLFWCLKLSHATLMFWACQSELPILLSGPKSGIAKHSIGLKWNIPFRFCKMDLKPVTGVSTGLVIMKRNCQSLT